jgi:carbamoyltransferase
MVILGLSSFFHDSAATLWVNGQLVAAAQEERFNRKKNTDLFPIQAINSCFQAAGLSPLDIDHIGFYEKPYFKFYRVIFDHLRSWPKSYPNFRRSIPKWLEERLSIPLTLQSELGFEKRPFFVPHHLSHAASTFFMSPFEKAAICVADSVGEWASLSCGSGEHNTIQLTKEMRYPESLGLIYTAMTTYLGFKAHSGEGKVMGLASYGKPSFTQQFEQMIHVLPDGSFKVDPSYFPFSAGNRMYSKKILGLFGPARRPESEITERHQDIAASLQEFFENTLIKITQTLQKETRQKNLCLAGGVFLNCSANQKILEHSGFENVFIQPAAGDAGGALGVAAYINHGVLGNPRLQSQDSSSLGPSFAAGEIERALRAAGFKFQKLDREKFLKTVCTALLENKTVGWFQGRMEFGPRALGNRSILASPLSEGMRDHLNHQVKRRESFRPFGPVVCLEDASRFFDLSIPSPFMLLAPKVKRDMQNRLPAITHVDQTARIQTLSQTQNPILYSLLREFEKKTGFPILINTSFNLRGEPVVCTPEDAVSCFKNTKLNGLAIEDYWVEKTEPGDICGP